MGKGEYITIRGAKLCNTDFTGAYLAKAIFDNTSLEQANLSSEQLNQIRR